MCAFSNPACWVALHEAVLVTVSTKLLVNQKMIYLSATNAVVAAGLHSHRGPSSVLDSQLSKLGLVAEPASAPSQAQKTASLYTAMGWNRPDIVSEAEHLARKRRADPVRNRIESLHSDIVAKQDLDAAAKKCLEDDVRGIYQQDFGKFTERKSCEWFMKVQSKLSPSSQQHLSYLRGGLKPQEMQAMTTKMTVCRCFPDIGLQIQGLPDMTGTRSIVEMKNRLYPEHQMESRHRDADHAQLKVYLVLAELNNAYRQPVTGYLVEHMRIGTGTMLSVEYRDVPYDPVAACSVPSSAEAAGHMVITRYTGQQATQFWNARMAPALERFCRLAEKVIHDPQVRDMYTNAVDKDVWVLQHL